MLIWNFTDFADPHLGMSSWIYISPNFEDIFLQCLHLIDSIFVDFADDIVLYFVFDAFMLQSIMQFTDFMYREILQQKHFR